MCSSHDSPDTGPYYMGIRRACEGYHSSITWVSLRYYSKSGQSESVKTKTGTRHRVLMLISCFPVSRGKLLGKNLVGDCLPVLSA